MSNSFYISVKPEIAAAVVKIDANKTVIDENKVILVDIHDTDLPGAVTAIGNNLTAIGSNNTILADIHDTDLPGAVTKIESIQTDQFFSVSLSDIELAAADTERSDASGDYVKLKEIVVAVSGLYRITFDLKSDANTELIRGRIFKNGVAYGTEQDNNTTTWQNKSEDLVFTSGDLVQLYVDSVDITKVAYVQNFKVKGTISVSKGIVSID